MDIIAVTSQIKSLLKEISTVSDQTQRNNDNCAVIQYAENPLEPNLLAYCFDIYWVLMCDTRSLKKLIISLILTIREHLLPLVTIK